MKRYHGSNAQIEIIDLSKSKPYKDFGRGFYLSENEQQAMNMAKFRTTTLGGIFLNSYNSMTSKILCADILEVNSQRT